MIDFSCLKIIALTLPEGERFFRDDELNDCGSLDEIISYAHYSELSVIEDWAYDQNLIHSEDECSNRFDDMVEEYGAEAWAAMRNDRPMICEAFSDWMDNLISSDELHIEQINSYSYVNDFGSIF